MSIVPKTINFVKELPPIPVYLVSLTNVETLNHVLDLLISTCYQPLPFISIDCEWSRSSPIDIIQLGTSQMVVVIQTHKQPTLPSSLSSLLSFSHIIKIFKGSAQDKKRLSSAFNIVVSPSFDIENHFIDIGSKYHVTNDLSRDTFGPPSHPRSVFAANGLTCLLPKSKEISCSNWALESLSEDQINYAALDAYWIAKNSEIYIQNSNNVLVLERDLGVKCPFADKYSLETSNFARFNPFSKAIRPFAVITILWIVITLLIGLIT
ncbi:hypothetical protein GEMRC1_009487 [Eukaryota sp. GEM-RC1]